MPAGDGRDLVHVAWQPPQMRRDHRDGSWRDGPLERLRRHVECDRIDVDEHRPEAGHARDLGHDPERQRGHHDLAAFGQIHGLKNVEKRHASVRRGCRMHRSKARRERRFELRDVRAVNELIAPDHVRDQLLRVGNHASAVT